MRNTKRIATWVASSLAVLTSAILISFSASATDDGSDSPQSGQSITDADCTREWGEASASTYCTSTSVVARTSTSTNNRCNIDVSSCSISVNVTDDTGTATSFTYTPTFPALFGSSGDGIHYGNVDGLDICFAEETPNTWTPRVKVGCGPDETNSASAKANGFQFDGTAG